MFENPQSVAFLSDKQQAQFLASIQNNEMHTFAALLMLDAGLRVSEVTDLVTKDFNFQKAEVYVHSKKKRATSKNQWRTVPLSKRIINAAANWFKSFKDLSPDTIIFPVCRQQFHRYFYAKSDGLVHPHLLRHTCATNLIEQGNGIHVVKDILGHSDSRTTEIYVHASKSKKELAIASLDKTSWFGRIKEKYFPSVKPHILPMAIGNKYHVGRETELMKLVELHEKKINCLILAPQGFGKSHLLDNFQAEKLLRIDDCNQFRKTLANMIIKLCDEDKNTVASLLELKPEVITKESQKRLIEILISITEPNEYTLIFDDVSKLTPTAVNGLEKLNTHFHIIAAARSVEVKNASWLTNFERINLKALNRAETMEMVVRGSFGFRDAIEDFETYKNHIWRSTNGVPLFIAEMMQRFEKEKFVSIEQISSIQHTAARGGIDASYFVLMLFAVLVLFKFWAKEAMPDDKEAFMLFGAVGMIIIMFGRFGLGKLKRKFV